jgi:hypothetical protein
MNLRTQVVLAATMILVTSRAVPAQDKPAPAGLPDAPTPKQDQNDTAQKPDKNIFATPLGLITKRSYVYPELATTPGPLTSKEKFELFLDKSVSPPQILSSAAGAGISEARGTLAGYGQGGEGFGRRFASSMASGASSHFFGTFLLPAMFHEDPRFFVRLQGGFGARAGHALRRAIVIRTDTGKETFNLPGTLGPLLAEALANAYLPASEQTAGKTFERAGIRIGFSAANNLLKEYWPSIFKKLRVDKIAPGLHPDTTQPAPPGKPVN